MRRSDGAVNGRQSKAALQIFWIRLKEYPLARVGPRLITGVADDDPSGIVIYSQAGAQFGFNMLWTMPLALPLMSAIQSMRARIGRVTGKGVTANIKASFPPIVIRSVVLLLIANTSISPRTSPRWATSQNVAAKLRAHFRLVAVRQSR